MTTSLARHVKVIAVMLAVSITGSLASHESAAFCVFATDTGARLHWPPGAVVGNTIDPSGAELLPPGPVVAAINAAQFDWNATPGAPRWTFALGAAGAGDPFLRDGINIIGFGDLSALGVGPEVFATTALWYVSGGPNDGLITEFGIMLNNDPARTWGWQVLPAANNQVDIQSIALHQLGHVLGTAHSNTDGLGACAEGLPYSDVGPVMQPSFSAIIASNPDLMKRVLEPDDVASNNLPVVGENPRSSDFRSVDTEWRLWRGPTTLAGNAIAGTASYLIYPGACTDLDMGVWAARAAPQGDSLNTYAEGTVGDYTAQDYSAGGVGNLWRLRAGNNTPTADLCAPQKELAVDKLFFGGDPATLMQLPRSNAVVTTCPIPVPAGTRSLTARWSQYLDLPRGSGYLPYVEYRFFTGGSWYEWRNVFPADGLASGSTQTWATEEGDLTEATSAAWVQLRFGVECSPRLAADHLNCSPALLVGLLYDDLVLYAQPGVGAPAIHVFPGSVPQSTFVDGTMLGVNCTAAPCWPGIRGTDLGPPIGINDNVNSPLGDSLTVTITSSLGNDGNGINWKFGYDKTIAGGMALVHFNPGFLGAFDGPRVIFRLFDPMTRTWSPQDSTDLYPDDVQIVAGVPIVHGSRYRWDWPPADKVAAGAALPGGFTINGVGLYAGLAFLPHGTRLQYYFKGVDKSGGQTYSFSTDRPAYEVQDPMPLPGSALVAPDVVEFDVLPGVYPPGSAGSLVAGKTNTPVLNLDGAYTAWSFGYDPVTQALRGLGVRADRYRTLQGLGEGAHIGGHELPGDRIENPRSHFPNMNEYAIKDSLSRWYRIIIDSGHMSGDWTVEDEQDARLIREWMQSETGVNGGDRCLFVTGDDFFNGMLNPPSGLDNAEQTSLSQNVLGVQMATTSWSGAAGTPRPVINDRFADPTSGPTLGPVGGYTYPVDGDCPWRNRFDALTMALSSEVFVAARYPGAIADTAAAVARLSELDPVVDRDRSKAIGYGYSFQFIRKSGFVGAGSIYDKSGIEDRMIVLTKFLTSCRGARSGAPGDTGVCWPCPTPNIFGAALTKSLASTVGNWATETSFQSARYGPLYPIQDPLAITAVDARAPGEVPQANALAQNRPNPFNPWTEIQYSVAMSGRVTIRIFNVAGKLVRTLVDKDLPAGLHVARWDGRGRSGESLASGVYFYRITFPDMTVSSRKMIMLR